MTHSHRVRLSKLSLGLIVALAAAPAFAQSTSAGVGGQVTSAGGQPVTGAEVTIVHTESGTVSRATTDASGRYNARGLRVGGPYTITITKAGEGTRTEDNVYLALNQTSTVNAALTGDLTTLERAQDLRLERRQELADAIEEHRATARALEEPDALLGDTRNLVLLLPEEHRLCERLGERGGIDDDEGPGGARGRCVDGASHLLFAGTGLALHEDREVLRRDALERGEELTHGR